MIPQINWIPVLKINLDKKDALFLLETAAEIGSNNSKAVSEDSVASSGFDLCNLLLFSSCTVMSTSDSKFFSFIYISLAMSEA